MTEQAISAARQAIEIAPKDITARLITASAHIRDKRPDLARPVATEVMELDPSFSVSRFTETQYYRDLAVLTEFGANLRAAGLPE